MVPSRHTYFGAPNQAKNSGWVKRATDGQPAQSSRNVETIHQAFFSIALPSSLSLSSLCGSGNTGSAQWIHTPFFLSLSLSPSFSLSFFFISPSLHFYRFLLSFSTSVALLCMSLFFPNFVTPQNWNIFLIIPCNHWINCLNSNLNVNDNVVYVYTHIHYVILFFRNKNNKM